jgi:hypothetical protein
MTSRDMVSRWKLVKRTCGSLTQLKPKMQLDSNLQRIRANLLLAPGPRPYEPEAEPRHIAMALRLD